MRNFISYEKMSKKEKKKINLKNRRGWNEVSPVTKSIKNPKAYNRRKSRKIDNDFTGFYFHIFCFIRPKLAF